MEKKNKKKKRGGNHGGRVDTKEIHQRGWERD